MVRRKLTTPQVEAILLARDGQGAALARAFGVSSDVVNAVRKRTTYREVPVPVHPDRRARALALIRRAVAQERPKV